MNDENEFIPRNFIKMGIGDIVDFETVINSSNISIILGEIGSGKTYQLKHYYKTHQETSKYIELVTLSDDDIIDKSVNVVLLDSIDEALFYIHSDKILKKKISLYILKCIKINKNMKFVIACRNNKWKNIYKEEFETIDSNIRIWKFDDLRKYYIDKIIENISKQKYDNGIKKNYLRYLVKDFEKVKQEKLDLFWNYIEKNYLYNYNYGDNILIIKNFKILLFFIRDLIEANFFKHQKLEYYEVYQKRIEEYLLISTDNESNLYHLDKISLDEMLDISSCIIFYMVYQNEKDILTKNISKLASDISRLVKRDIRVEKLKIILNNRALIDFLKSNSIKNYLTAYFFEKNNINVLKFCFNGDEILPKYTEAVVHYFTNQKKKMIVEKKLISKNPFIFRKHPFLDKNEQEELLKSIINKLKNRKNNDNWKKFFCENFFYNSTLVKFDKIDNVFSFVKNIELENKFLLEYIMKLFSENYSIEFEKYVFEILDEEWKKDKGYCFKLINYSYNTEYKYNLTLFDFINKYTKKEFFYSRNYQPKNRFPVDRSYKCPKDYEYIEKLFYILCGFEIKNNQIIGRNIQKFNKEKTFALIPFIDDAFFVEVVTSPLIDIKDIEIWFNIMLENNNYIEIIIYKILENNSISKERLQQIISFVQQEKFDYCKFITYQFSPYSLKLPINDIFWEIYFSNKIQDFSEVEKILNFYDIKKNDIERMQKRYPFENHLIKTFQLLSSLQEESNESFLILEKKQLESILNKVKLINIKENEELLQYCLSLNSYNEFKPLEDFIFELLEYFVNDKEKCNYYNYYIEISYNNKYDYNLRLFNFMKRNNLFYKGENSEKLFFYLYIPNTKIKKQLFLLQYISFNFFSELENISITDYERWFNYFSKNYNRELLKNNLDYKKCLGWIGYKLLRYYNEDIDNSLLEEIILFFSKLEIKFEKEIINGVCSHYNLSDISIEIKEEKSYSIPEGFWSIYFSDKIEDFEEVKNFIDLYEIYEINEKNVEQIVEKYPIHKYSKKYEGLNIKFLIDKIAKIKQYNIDIQNVNKENFYRIFKHVVSQESYGRYIDEKLKKDLEYNYKNFIKLIIESFFTLEKKYYNEYVYSNKEIYYDLEIYNYLFNNVLNTKDDIDNALKSDKNYEKLFWFIILNCIRIDSRENNKIIEEKFGLFIKVAKEIIDKVPTCGVVRHRKLGNSLHDANIACQNICNILCKINFDREKNEWREFFEYIKDIEKRDSKYKTFFELICEINNKPYSLEVSLQAIKEKNENSFSHFAFIYGFDINKAFEYFYKYIYKNSNKEFSKLLNFLKENKSNPTLKDLNEDFIERILIDYYNFKKSKTKSSIADIFDREILQVEYLINSMWANLDTEKLEELKKYKNEELSKKAFEVLNSKYNTRELIFENLLENYSDSNKPLIITEGKTDWKHLKKALERLKQNGEYQNLYVQFLEYDEKDVLMSDSELAVHVRTYSNTPQLKKHIMIFDRDATEKKDIKKIFNPNKHFTYHDNKVYSLFIPPIGKLNKICIEFYYKQEEVQKAWFEGKRLFYGNEFDKESQKSLCGEYKTDKPCPQPLDILDGDNKKKVYHINDDEKKENNIALSKNKFSKNIYYDVEGFDNFDIKNFRLIFDVIDKIVND